MGKKNDFIYLDDVGLFRTREAAMIYDYVRNSSQPDGRTEIIEWTQLRDALYGELGFMEHDDYELFEVEILNGCLKEILERTGDRVEVIRLDSEPGADERIQFMLHIKQS